LNDASSVNLTNNDEEIGYQLLDAKGNKVLYYPKGYDANSYHYTPYAMDSDGGNKVGLISLTTYQYFEGPFPLSLSPDGTKVAYVYYPSDCIERKTKFCIKNSDGSGASHTLLECDGSNWYQTAFSPDGTKIFLWSSQLYIVNTDGSGAGQILQDFQAISMPVFSPDGTKFVFEGRIQASGNEGIYIVDVSDMFSYSLLVSSALYSINPNSYPYGLSSLVPVSWESNRILLQKPGFTDTFGNTISAPACFIMNQDGTGLSKIDDNCYGQGLSPDGTEVVLQQLNDNNRNEIWYLITSNGQNKQCISQYSGTVFAWSKDNRYFCYTYSPRLWTGWPNYQNRLYLSASDGSGAYNLNSSLNQYSDEVYFISNNRIVYSGDDDIWSDTLTSFLPDTSLPDNPGKIKVVIPDGAGEKGTYNPDSGKPISIGFKGSTPGKFHLRVLTPAGNQIFEQIKDVDSAEGWFDWLPGKIPSGVYIVYIEGPGVKMRSKIAILR